MTFSLLLNAAWRREMSGLTSLLLPPAYSHSILQSLPEALRSLLPRRPEQGTSNLLVSDHLAAIADHCCQYTMPEGPSHRRFLIHGSWLMAWLHRDLSAEHTPLCPQCKGKRMLTEAEYRAAFGYIRNPGNKNLVTGLYKCDTCFWEWGRPLPPLSWSRIRITDERPMKKASGRKRHLLVDTLGLLLKVVVHPAKTRIRLLLIRLAC